MSSPAVAVKKKKTEPYVVVTRSGEKKTIVPRTPEVAPSPSNIVVKKGLAEKAQEILDTQEVLTLYVRRPSFVGKSSAEQRLRSLAKELRWLGFEPEVFKDTITIGEVTSRQVKSGLREVVSKGQIDGTIVHFIDDGNHYIGWSKYHNRVETLSSTKKHARRTAIERGLVDGLIISPGGSLFSKTTGKSLPMAIEKAFPSFLGKLKKAYDLLLDDLDNVEKGPAPVQTPKP